MYRCPSCGAGLTFNPETQKIKCYYCNQEFEKEEIEKTQLKSSKEEKGFKIETQETTNNEVEENSQEPKDNVYEAIVYRCTQCGAELITTDETIATFCSYCGSSALLERKDVKKKKPNYIIPFTKTKEQCEAAYKSKLSKALFAPKNMADEQQIQKIRGIYMPYWIYSFEKDGQDLSRGQKYKCRRGDYVYYRDFDIKTNIKAGCSGITHDASANFSDSLSEAIAPFSIKEKKEFSPTYLTGFYADSEDVQENVYMDESNKVANKEASRQLMKDRTYSKYSAKPNVMMTPKTVELGLFPVYFLATKNKTGDRISYAVVNGQTGKVAAEIPIDFKKYIIASLLLAIPIFLLLNAAFTITPGKVLVTSMVFSILSLILICVQNSGISKREKRIDDKGYVSKENTDIQRKNKANKSKKTYKSPKVIRPILGLIISIIVLFVNPVSDMYYYAGAALSIVMVILSFGDIIKGLNLLTTRKLPQLEKRGGDENE